VLFERLHSSCSLCPLQERRRVWGQGPSNPLFAVIGEAPGSDEDYQGKPFVGAAGSMITQMLSAAGVVRSEVWFTNPICCRPPKNDIHSHEAETARSCCEVGFREELKFLLERTDVLVPVGNTALLALGIEPKITERRGYVHLKSPRTKIIPTFHPSYILRGQYKEKPTVICDLAKAKRISTDGWIKPTERFNTHPTLKQVEEFAARVQSWLAVDIETTSLDPTTGHIVVVGLALSATEAISIPFIKQGGLPYWNKVQEQKVRKILQRLFREHRLLFQNALFDVRWLQHAGFSIPERVDDLLLLHHSVHPELPHSLRYIASVYTDVPYWKGVLHDRVGRITEMPDEELRTYNLRDAAVLLRAYPNVLSDADDLGVTGVYRDISCQLIWPILEMVETGVPLDRPSLARVREDLEGSSQQLAADLRQHLGLPPAWDPGKPDHIRLLLYPTVPKQFTRAAEALSEYDGNSKRRKDTKKYRELRDIASILEARRLLYQPTCANRVTASGESFSIDDTALLERKLAARRRKDAIQAITKKRPQHLEEVKEINRLLTFLDLYLEYTKKEKLLNTFTEFPVQKDGRVHTSYLIHGTATGRLSSRDPNLQNIPKEIRKVFKAPKGWKIVRADYSNLELRVLAYVSDDPVAIDMFERGLNAHDVNTETMLGIDKSDPKWDIKRKGIKMGRFARNYGGSLESIYRKLILAVPDFDLSFHEYQAAERRYEDAHPAYVNWFRESSNEVLAKKMLRTVFGRIRIFLGDNHEIVREGPNFLIQSPAADIINKATIALRFDLRRKGLEAKLCAQVHDELAVLCPDNEVPTVEKLMKKHMEAERQIGSHKVRFPVELTTGESWG
jgi:uracil-DNA glycosylase family 4